MILLVPSCHVWLAVVVDKVPAGAWNEVDSICFLHLTLCLLRDPSFPVLGLFYISAFVWIGRRALLWLVVSYLWSDIGFSLPPSSSLHSVAHISGGGCGLNYQHLLTSCWQEFTGSFYLFLVPLLILLISLPSPQMESENNQVFLWVWNVCGTWWDSLSVGIFIILISLT